MQRSTLYVVATPIGNLEDFSTRAIKTLRAADLILVEDTRRFGLLKQRLAIQTPTLSYHQQNEVSRTREAISKLAQGSSLALVSDAGTPCISDPGYRLVLACKEAGYNVSPVPGPCAATAALSVSGFEINDFFFAGFLPTKAGAKRKRLDTLLALNTTIVLYESPHRIVKTIGLIAELDPKRELLVSRELTKLYEQTLRGTAEEVLEMLQTTKQKGEFVLIIRRG